MGADMCIDYSCFIGEMSNDERKKRIIEAIQKDDMRGNEWGYLINDIMGLKETDNIKEEVIRVVEEFFECLNWRDVTFITLFDMTIHLTGGLSWGDSPSEATDKFYHFYVIPPHIKQAGMIDLNDNPLDLFIRTYKDKLSEEMMVKLNSLRVSEAL